MLLDGVEDFNPLLSHPGSDVSLHVHVINLQDLNDLFVVRWTARSDALSEMCTCPDVTSRITS